MTCDLYRELISAQMDGEVTETEARHAHAHLQQCDACRRFAALLLEQQGALAAAPIPKQPKGLQERIRVRIGVGAGSIRPAAAAGSILGRHGIPLRIAHARPTSRVTSLLGRP